MCHIYLVRGPPSDEQPGVCAETLRFSFGLCCYPLLCPSLPQRIAGWYILYDVFRSEVHGTNPFLPVFVDCLRKTASNAEKLLLVHLVTSPAFAREVGLSSSNLMPDFSAYDRGRALSALLTMSHLPHRTGWVQKLQARV